MDLSRYASVINKIAKDHGFYEDDNGNPIDRNFGEVIALMHSELSEALEEHRSGKPLFYYNPDKPDKPEGAAVELADCLIRILDTMFEMEITDPAGQRLSIDSVVTTKIVYNNSRPYKHGRKY